MPTPSLRSFSMLHSRNVDVKLNIFPHYDKLVDPSRPGVRTKAAGRIG
jgi:hypothetical protein